MRTSPNERTAAKDGWHEAMGCTIGQAGSRRGAEQLPWLGQRQRRLRLPSFEILPFMDAGRFLGVARWSVASARDRSTCSWVRPPSAFEPKPNPVDAVARISPLPPAASPDSTSRLRVSPTHSMPRILTNPIGHFSLTALALLLCAPPLMAQEALRVPDQSRSPQLMLYVSKTLGSSSSIPVIYGLRLEEARSPAPLTQISQPAGPGPTQLLDLQMQAHADMQVEFGSRVSWDIARGTLGPTSTSSAFVIRLPITRPLLPTAIHPRPSNLAVARLAHAKPNTHWTPSMLAPGTAAAALGGRVQSPSLRSGRPAQPVEIAATRVDSFRSSQGTEGHCGNAQCGIGSDRATADWKASNAHVRLPRVSDSAGQHEGMGRGAEALWH